MSDNWQTVLKKGFRSFETDPSPIVEARVIAWWCTWYPRYLLNQLDKDIERHERLKLNQCTFIDKIKYYKEGINLFK
jgi:hypothetical protein